VDDVLCIILSVQVRWTNRPEHYSLREWARIGHILKAYQGHHLSTPH